MAQVIKIKRGGISGLSGASTVQGELIIATGSIGSIDGPLLLAHGDSLGLVAGRIYAGSSVPTISDSELNGILFYDTVNKKFVRLESGGNVNLDIEATSFSGTTDGVNEGSTNLYYTDARVKTKLNTENVVSGSAASVRSFLNVENGADVTDTANVTAAGALMDSEVTDLDGIKSLTVPNNTTISTFGASLIDDTDATTARTTLGVDAAGTDNSTDVTLNTTSYDYLSISNQEITLGAITNADLAGSIANSKLTNSSITVNGTSVSLGGSVTLDPDDLDDTSTTNKFTTAGDISKLAGIEANADVTDTANVTAAGALMDSEVSSLSGIKTLTVPDNTTISAFGKTLIDDADAAAARTTLGVDAAGTDNSTDVTLAGSYDYITISGQTITRNQITNDDLAGSIANAKLANSAITIAGQSTSLGGSVTAATILGAGSTTNLSEGTNLYYTDARVKTKLNSEGVISGSGMSPTFNNLTVEGNLSVEGTLTTVNSNEVNIGDRIVVLNTANGAGDAGIQVHDTVTNQTGSLLWDTDGDYWKAGQIGSEKRVVTFNADNPTNTGFVYTNASDEIIVAAGSTAGDILQWNGSAFAVSNEIDGGTY